MGEIESKFSVQEREKMKPENLTFSRIVGVTSSEEKGRWGQVRALGQRRSEIFMLIKLTGN